jgi:hypothetical protein
MAALFAVGVMSVGWMIFMAAIIAIEKLLPWRRPANSAVALVLLVLSLGVTFAPERVPGLTLPGSSSAHHAVNSADDARKRSPAPSRTNAPSTPRERRSSVSPLLVRNESGHLVAASRAAGGTPQFVPIQHSGMSWMGVGKQLKRESRRMRGGRRVMGTDQHSALG